jgi:hypothetical protein
MSVVRQAHLPGNYELYDPASNMLGPGICKGCWEDGGVRNTTSLQTVWVNVEGTRMVWWLCNGHLDAMRANPAGMEFLKSEDRTVRSPRVW